VPPSRTDARQSTSTQYGCRTVSAVTAMATGSGEGEQFWFLGTLATIRVPGEVSEGRFALIEFLFPLHASPPLHTHPQTRATSCWRDGSRFRLGTALQPRGRRGGSCAVGGRAHLSGWTATLRGCSCSAPSGARANGARRLRPSDHATLPPSDAQRPSPGGLEAIFRAHGQVNTGHR